MLCFTKNVGSYKKEELTIVKSNFLCLTYKVSREVFFLFEYSNSEISHASAQIVTRNVRDKLKIVLPNVKDISGTLKLAVIK